MFSIPLRTVNNTKTQESVSVCMRPKCIDTNAFLIIIRDIGSVPFDNDVMSIFGKASETSSYRNNFGTVSERDVMNEV